MWSQRSTTVVAVAAVLLAAPGLAAERKGPAGAKPKDIRLATGGNLASLISKAQAAGGELVFTPLPPCRVIDTRKPGAGGRFAAFETRSYVLRGPTTDYTGQGGNPAGCGIPGLTGATMFENEAKALALNIIAVGPLGAGDLRAWPANQSAPTASVVNYSNLTLLNIANGVILPTCDEVAASPCAAGDISFQAEVAGTFLVVDVMGYFHTPAATGTVDSVTAGTGLAGGGTGGDLTLSIDAPFQLPQSCTDGQIARWNAAGGVWECSSDNAGTGDVTGVAADSGLTGGGTSGDLTLGLAPTYQLPQSCAEGQVAKWSSTSGVWECLTLTLAGVGFHKTDIYENVAPAQVSAGSMLTNTSACNDANDIPLEGTCRPVASGIDDVVIASEQAINWSSDTLAAEFRCVFKNQGTTQVNTQTRILCINVP